MSIACRPRSRLAGALVIPTGLIVLAGCASSPAGDSGTHSGTHPAGSRSGTVTVTVRAPSTGPVSAGRTGAPPTMPVLHPTVPTATPVPAAARSSAPPTSACPQAACVAGPQASLPGGQVVRLWSQPDPGGRPVVELVASSTPVEWMVIPRGQGGVEQVRCASAAATSDCVVVSRLGVHAAVGEMVLVVGDHLVDTGAFVVALTPQVSVTDYDHDGYLDLAARDSDYRPNFAEGHLFDHTYRYDSAGGRFVSTGCTANLTHPADTPGPVALQYGHCPTP